MFDCDNCYSSLGIKQVGDDYKVINETNSVADVWFVGTKEDCELFLNRYNEANSVDADIMRRYVHDIRSYRVWMEM